MKFKLYAILTTVFWLIVIAIPAAAQLRPMVYTDKTVDAPSEQVWQDWTTAEGLESFLAPKAIVEARPGGAYAIWFTPDAPEGQRGSDDGTVIGLQTSDDGSRMISFTWAMPPNMPEIRPHMTIVQLWFVPEGESRTRLRLFHTGFGDTKGWQEGRDYFAKTWPEVLARYREYVEAEN